MAYDPIVNGVEYIFYAALRDNANPGSFKANPTIASGDFKVSKDGGALANLSTLPAVTPAGSIWVKFTLSGTEMTANNVSVQAIDQTSPKEWADDAWLIQPVAIGTPQVDLIDAPNATAIAAIQNGLSTFDPGAQTVGVGSIEADVLTEAATAEDFFTRIGAQVTLNMFGVDTGATYGDAVAGSVVKEIADNAGGGGGASAADIADAVLDEALADHTTGGTLGERLGRIPNAAAGGNGGLPTVNENNQIVGIAGTLTTLDALDSAQDIQHSATQGKVDAVKVDTAATLVDTNELQGDWANGGRLDNILDSRASSTEVVAVQNNTRVVRVVPTIIERPDSGTATYRIELLLYDGAGGMEAPDSAPTIALVNQAGTDRSARLDSTTMALVSTGYYRAIYTASDTDALEQLVWTFSVVEGAATRLYGNGSVVVDTTAVDFTTDDRAMLEDIESRLPAALDGNGLMQANADRIGGIEPVQTSGKLWVLDGSGNAVASASAVADVPTNAELATALGTADDAVLAAIAALNNLSQANIRTAVGLASANLDTQLADLPTTGELATALGTADDAMLAAISALNNLSSAQVAALIASGDDATLAAITEARDYLVNNYLESAAAELAKVPRKGAGFFRHTNQDTAVTADVSIGDAS